MNWTSVSKAVVVVLFASLKRRTLVSCAEQITMTPFETKSLLNTKEKRKWWIKLRRRSYLPITLAWLSVRQRGPSD